MRYAKYHQKNKHIIVALFEDITTLEDRKMTRAGEMLPIQDLRIWEMS